DPTADDIGCEFSRTCRGELDPIVLEVPEDIVLHLLPNETLPTLESFHPLHSTITIGAGRFVLPAEQSTEDLPLIDVIHHGQEWDTAQPLAPSTVTFEPPGTYRFQQLFEFASGVLGFSWDVTPSDGKKTVIECANFSACERISARYVDGPVDIDLEYSCGTGADWVDSPLPHPSPTFVFLDDGTRFELHTLDCDYDPVGGEEDPIRQRRFVRVAVDFRGLLLDISEERDLVLTSEAKQQHQEFRFLFGESIDGIYGVDLVECPNISGGECELSVVGSRAYYLDANLQRIEEIGITDFNRGSADE
ncbi:MAG: hypothetical protein AAF517_05220, partial [Planctomycetota bacterium]